MTAMRCAATAALLLLGQAPSVATAGPDIPEPAVRLVAAGGLADGVYRAGLEIRLGAGWHTYWRNPGDSGIPPRLDAAGSGNLAALDVAFPAPERYFDGYGTTLVYHDGVLLPLAVTPADPAAPVELSLAVDFGYCKEICVPGHAAVTLTLRPDAALDPDGAALLAEAAAAVPVPEAEAGPSAPRIVDVARAGPPPGVVTITVEAAGAVDLFAEPPEGWYLAVPAPAGRDGGRSVFTLPLDGAAKDATIAGAEIRFTVAGPDGAVEAVRRLD